MKHILLLSLLWAPFWPLKAQPGPGTTPLSYLSPSGIAPDWSRLDPYQRTITKSDFLHEWQSNYYAGQGPSPSPFVTVMEDRVRIVKHFKHPGEVYDLLFADCPSPPSPARTWRAVQELPPASSLEKPLDGVRIAIDPGHIGGEWARMEQRWFFIPPRETDSSPPATASQPVKEGEIVLRVAELLESKLTEKGAKVSLVRRKLEPVTTKRPHDFVAEARLAGNFPPAANPENNRDLASTAERLFYLNDEIRARARMINEQLKPDLAICLHVNAEPWGDPENPDFVAANHFHMLINGCYSDAEIAFDDQRFELLLRLLQRMHPEEMAISNTVAGVMAEATGLPPYLYPGFNARRTPLSDYVWSRNLLATRVYECPVIFFEPYVMNHEVTYTRVQAGEYPGTREILGKTYVNIYEEYAKGVADGVIAYFRNHRRQ